MIQIKTLHQRLLMVECTRDQPSHIRSWRDSTPVVRDDECLGKALHVSWYYALCHTSPWLQDPWVPAPTQAWIESWTKMNQHCLELISSFHPKRLFRVFYMPSTSDRQWAKWGERMTWPVQRVTGFTGVRQCLASGQQYESSAQGVTHSAPTSTHNLVRGQQACLSEHTCPQIVVQN